ncbi:hypothetical protein RJ640_026108 [Escallonia rubra]|uniref:DUF7815 domain-containing protein n=1 Tax=Escallonia rubra TaxID=112253 RepID=A0AA88RSR7_9ASTE|nr:hypothetical protein RJ640_026108 [Escallonia rubra]
MALEVSTDLIRRLQIALRAEAGLPSYDPADPTLPALPSLAASVAGLDPSPPYLRCRQCKGKLLRGLQSLICIYCGRRQPKDVPPDPIAFNTTSGYRWLLGALDLDGSETIGPSNEGNEPNRGQSKAEAKVTLSELLDLKIAWPEESEKAETSVTNETREQSRSTLNVAGVDLDDFFSQLHRNKVTSVFEEQPEISKIEGTETKAFEGQGDFSSFQNVAAARSSADARSDAFSGWEADFQSADAGNQQVDSKAVDGLISSTVGLSAHMDSVFGRAENFKDREPNDSPVPSTSMANDWVEGDLWNNVNSVVSQRTEQFDSAAKDDSGDSLDNPTAGSVDWFQDNQLQTNIRSPPKNEASNDSVVSQQTEQFDLAAKDDGDDYIDDPTAGSIDWFQDNQWQTNIASPPTNQKTNDSGVSQQTEQLDLAAKDEGGDNLDNPTSDRVDWFQDNQWQTNITSPSENQTTNDSLVSQQTQQFDVGGNNLEKSTTSDSIDWFQDNKWQANITSPPKKQIINEDDDSFGEWNDFTSSTAAQNPSRDAWKQSDNEISAVTGDMSDINLFSSTNNFKEMDFSSFSPSNQHVSAEVNKTLSELPIAERCVYYHFLSSW